MNQFHNRNNNYQPSNFYNQNSNSSNNVYNMRKNERVFNKHVISEKVVKNAFKLFAIEQKYLNKKGFDDALEYIFGKIPIPSLHHTHLSSKLYNIFNVSGNLKLSEEEFLLCIKQILSNQNKRLHLSMMAMMTFPNGAKKSIDLNELKEFFYESFVQGYKHMAYKINQKPEEFKVYGFPVVSINQMEAWARQFEKKIKNGFEKDLKLFNPSITDNISFDNYKKWIYNDQTLFIKYGFKTINIATSLIIFDDVIFDENN